MRLSKKHSKKLESISATNSAKWTEEQKDRLLFYLKKTMHDEERAHSQVGHPTYRHIATHEQSGHKIGSRDGVRWHDLATGEPFHAPE